MIFLLPPFPLTTPITCFMFENLFCSTRKLCGVPPLCDGQPSQLDFVQLPALLQLLFSGIFISFSYEKAIVVFHQNIFVIAITSPTLCLFMCLSFIFHTTSI